MGWAPLLLQAACTPPLSPRLIMQPGLTAGLAAWHAATSGAPPPPSSPTRGGGGAGGASAEAPGGTTRAAGKKGIEYVLFSPSWTAGSVAAAVSEGLADSAGRSGKVGGAAAAPSSPTGRAGPGRPGVIASTVGSSVPVGSVAPLLSDVFGGGPDVQTAGGGSGGGDPDSDGDGDEHAFGTQAPPLISSLSRQANAQLQRIVEHGFGAAVRRAACP